MLILPMTNDGKRTATIDIDTGIFIFTTYYNYSTRMWHMDMLDGAGNDFAIGLSLVPDIDVLRAYTVEAEEIGEIRVADIGDTGNKTTESLGVEAIVTSWLPGEFEETYPLEQPRLPPLTVDLDDVLQ